MTQQIIPALRIFLLIAAIGFVAVGTRKKIFS